MNPKQNTIKDCALRIEQTDAYSAECFEGKPPEPSSEEAVKGVMAKIRAEGGFKPIEQDISELLAKHEKKHQAEQERRKSFEVKGDIIPKPAIMRTHFGTSPAFFDHEATWGQVKTPFVIPDNITPQSYKTSRETAFEFAIKLYPSNEHELDTIIEAARRIEKYLTE